ncbi:cytochrome P450 6a2-like [Uranotaenia lowii]|uniref:cytochrome P450 6a2-like n=1 Tax=Uranotaenia lowii TaxID=190385 RepID=UPI002478531C|nr:cytochrome P450 6a2-like [Uranotaenia lowii]
MIVYLILLAVALGFFWFRGKYSYWKERNVPFVEPSFPFGSLKGMNKRHLAMLAQDLYNELKDSGKKFGGIWFFVNPVALILDLDFAKDVFVKDFQYFHDRGLYSNEKADPISAHLVTLEGSKWKNMRSKLTPTFTSGKMKMMFPTLVRVSDEFIECLECEAAKGVEVEMKDFLARFTTDIIGNCAFGLECNSLKNPDADFRIMGRKALSMTPMIFLRRMMAITFKGLARKLNVRTTDPEVAQFFIKAVEDTIDYREKNNIQRNDFMDLMIKLKNSEPLEDANSSQLGPITINEIVAQSFVFFVGGFETSATTMSYCLYELARNQEVQSRARENVLQILQKHGSLTYEAVHEMRYIENCINESLRMYPPLPNLLRETTKDYHVPEMNVTLQKNYQVLLPVYAIHHDPRYHPDPETFNPDRFNPDQSANRHPMAFVPFGEGPRNCIGLRFGMMQARVGLAVLLKNFRFRLSPKTPVPLKIVANSSVLTSEGGLWLHIERL